MAEVNEDGFPGLQEPFVAPTINLSIILDVSPSMEERWSQTLSGINEYLGSLRKDQQENEQDYKVTMITFSNRVDKIYDNVVLDALPTFTEKNLRPTGSGTALYKAIHETITPISETGPVLIVIITDGEDNQSSSTDQHLADTVLTERQKLGNYTYAYLGVAKEAWGNAARLHTAGAMLRGSSVNMNSRDYSASIYDSSSKGLAGSTVRYSKMMRHNEAARRVGVSSVSMSVTNFFDENADAPAVTATKIPDSDIPGWQTGK